MEGEPAWGLWFPVPPCPCKLHTPVILRWAPSVFTQSDHKQPLDPSISHLPILQAPSQRPPSLNLFPPIPRSQTSGLPTPGWNLPPPPLVLRIDLPGASATYPSPVGTPWNCSAPVMKARPTATDLPVFTCLSNPHLTTSPPG